MPKMLVSWEHAEDRTLERVAQEQRKRVQERIDVMGTMDAPPEAVGHYNWYIEIYGGANDVVARILNRGITIRTVYSPTMAIPSGFVRYKIDKTTKKFVKA
jgi:hypothetical protein